MYIVDTINANRNVYEPGSSNRISYHLVFMTKTSPPFGEIDKNFVSLKPKNAAYAFYVDRMVFKYRWEILLTCDLWLL